jgi:hypothetical protein
MKLHFDIQKTMAAVAFLMDRSSGQLDMFLGLKSLYLADKGLLTKRGKTITGDSFRSLPKGPVIWNTYKLFKGTADRVLQAEWDKVFSERVDHSIHALKKVRIDILSQTEMEALASAQDEILSIAPWEIADWLHKTCPEWVDPNGKSRPIEPETILRNAGHSDEEIAQIAESESLLKRTRALLGMV